MLVSCQGKVQKVEFDEKICDAVLEHAKKVADLDVLSMAQKVDADAKINQQIVRGNILTNDIIAQQLWTGVLVFIVVATVVLSGVYLSYLQLKFAFAATSKAKAGENEMEVSMSGVRLKSQVIGLIMLSVSLAFFYLYLTSVYKITILQGGVEQNGTAVRSLSSNAAASKTSP